jgi:hypothetical protein
MLPLSASWLSRDAMAGLMAPRSLQTTSRLDAFLYVAVFLARRHRYGMAPESHRAALRVRNLKDYYHMIAAPFPHNDTTSTRSTGRK